MKKSTNILLTVISSIALIITLLITFLPQTQSPVLGGCSLQSMVIFTADWMENEGDPPPETAVVSCSAELIINPQVNIFYPTCKVYLKKYNYGASEAVTIQLWKVTYTTEESPHYCYDTLLASATYDTTSWATNVWEWRDTASVGGDVWMYTDEVYAIVVNCTDSKYVCWGYKTTPGGFPNCYGTFCYSAGEGYCDGVDDIQYTNHYYTILIKGCWSVPPTVITQDGYLDNQSRAVMGGYVPRLGSQPYVNGYIDYGFTTDFGNDQFVRKITTIAGSGGYYAFALGGLPPGMTLYYRARIISGSGDFVAYGDTKSIFIPTLIPTIDCSVIQNDQWLCAFETIISNIDDADEVDLHLVYSILAGCYNSTEDVVMNEGVTEGGRYTWNSTAFEDFEAGQTYYYYATMVYGNSTLVRSDIKSFIRYDPNKSAWENWLDNKAQGYLGGWLPKINTAWLWWGLAAGLALIIFFAVGKKKGNWRIALAWGLVAAFALLYILVAAGLVNPWLVVLLSIVCGYIIYRLIFSSAKSGS